MFHKVVSAVRVLVIVSIVASTGALLAQTTRVSVGSHGEEGNRGSFVPDVSADGRFVAFSSDASTLVPNDTNGSRDIFVYDRQTGETTRVSVNSQGIQGNNDCNSPAISADGRFVAFDSWASNLVPDDTNDSLDVFVHDRQTGETTRVSVNSQGQEGNSVSFSENASISADGRFVAFGSNARNLVPDDTNAHTDVFVHDRQTGETTRVSVDSQGGQANDDSGRDGSRPAISADGRFVAFDSIATNLVASDTNHAQDIFVHDRQTGETTRVSVDSNGVQGNRSSSFPDLSADGRIVVFLSSASNLVPGDQNGVEDVFAYDRLSGETTRVNVSSLGGEADSGGTFLFGRWFPVISSDGRIVAFSSPATNLVWDDTNGVYDVFVHDRQTGATMRVSVDSLGQQGNAECNYGIAISDDGGLVAFASAASNLVPDDSNSSFDVFVHEGGLGPCTVPASWSNYGKGWPGTKGIPAFVATTDPVLCSTLSVVADNSAGVDTTGILFAGLARANLITAWGGTLLVRPLLAIALPIPAGGLALSGALPCDEALCGLPLFAQVVERDQGASRGVSFTPGLELRLGIE